MASHIPNLHKTSAHDAQPGRRHRLRRILLETLERRELLAADVVAWESASMVQTSTQAHVTDELVFTSLAEHRELASYDITQFLDRALGGSNKTALNQRPWFHLIEESYAKWSQDNGMAFSFDMGLQGEGEGGLVGEGEAGGPRLLSVAPNSGAIFSFNNVNLLTEAPTELVFRFDGSSDIDADSFAGISVTRAGGDGSFGDGNETTLTPGFIGIGDNTRTVVLRFASTLEDDLYRVELDGDVVQNSAGLKLQTRQFDSTPTDLTRDTVDFNLELGAQVIAVVPQPVDRLPNGGLDPKLDVVRVYFNNDKLNPATAENPAYYQLIETNDTVEVSDDVVRLPDAATYYADENMVELSFTSGQLDNAGSYRLRIGSRESAVPTPLTLNQPADSAGNIQEAAPLPGASSTGSFATILEQSIITTDASLLPLDFAGGIFEPGHRDIQDETHLNEVADASPEISTIAYNFALNRPYGVDVAGRPINTSITPEQIQRVREVFDFFSEVAGVDFVETESGGLTVVVGDLFPLGGAVSEPGGVIGIAGNGLAIMDGAESWNNSFAGDFFETAMHEIGHLLGLGHTYDLPFQTIMGAEGDLINPNAGLGTREWVYPGDHDNSHLLNLFRTDNRDVDTYRFTLEEAGKLTAETIAENLPNSSNLDTHMTLLRGVFEGTELVGYEVMASNDNSTGSDSFLNVDLQPGTYFISVTAKGNEDFNPLVANSGSGGRSQGAYQLRVSFESTFASTGTAPLSILDTSGTALDGDGDGLAGGDFNFWFRTSGVGGPEKTVYVDKSYNGPVFDGSAERPFNNLDFTNSVPTRPAAQRWPANHLQTGDVVRVVGSIGKPGDNPATTTDNRAYEIGRGGVGNAILSDGLALAIPQGVTMMIDAGAILKLQGSRISAGSVTAGINNSLSALQVLGTPELPVFFTSYRDQSLGVDTNPLITTPGAGDWGGLDFRNDIDREEGRVGYERQGIFLNYVSHADIRYGGGQVTVSSPSPTVNPINMSQARPSLLHNTIRFSADAAMSADPNSFEETRFTEARYQLVEFFSPDYDRVGPDIRGNVLLNNTTNGLFVRSATAAGGPLTTLNVAGRFDDTDIVHTLGENLIIAGSPGGSFVETTAPTMNLVQTLPATNGEMLSGTVVQYKVTAVDRFGIQGVPSAATPALTVPDGSSAVQLNNLPRATGNFVSRRLWRTTDGVNYRLVAELDGDTTSYRDRGTTLAATLANPNATSVSRARPDARLQIDPGIIIKAAGTRIEAEFGANLIAEGSADARIIFTSRRDDRYGAGSTFDTNNDGGDSNPSAGDWSGLVARHLSNVSIDHALITHGGGTSSVAGGFAGFSAIEVHQSVARIANSRLEVNASGTSAGSGNRDGRGPNDSSVIFVVGSQPVIYGNTIQNNSVTGTAAVSINANAMTSIGMTDPGRQTGTADRAPVGVGNVGPLLEGNSLMNNGLNGVRIRGEMLTTETIWDDTDIVHILQSEVIVPDLHTFGGLTLRSESDESLVIKLAGAAAGFTALGRPLDITDRIGGSVRVIGTPGFPVVLTSIHDDTVGAGFDPTGRPLLDTNNNRSASSPAPGNWRSIRLEPYANDRNVNFDVEYEARQIQDTGTNDTVTAAQVIGGLAGSLNGGDENLRLGFSIDGAIAAPQDIDVYSFSGTAGTMVWLDVDRTSGSLDAVVELIDASGQVIALSNNSLAESAGNSDRFVSSDPSRIGTDDVMGLEKDVFATPNSWVAGLAQDLYSVNPLDAGMRLILPGAVGTAATYYVRVRSSNLRPGDAPDRLVDPAAISEGLSTGNYRLQVRLQQSDESPGSTVRYADIRYATIGIETRGMPSSSPLLGQVAELQTQTGLGTTALGNIANSDRGSISVSGSLVSNGAAEDEDYFSFTISRDSTQSGGPHIATSFDIDYADGFGGPDTNLWVFNSQGQLVLIGTDSNIADDRAAPGSGSGLEDLTRGSSGARDAFIGSAELPEGDYTVVVTAAGRMPAALKSQFQDATTSEPNLRVEPITSVNRLVTERFGEPEQDIFAGPSQVLFANNIAQNRVEYTLADLTTYMLSGGGANSTLRYINAMTGALEALVGPDNTLAQFPRVNDAAMSQDGRLVAYQIPQGNQTDANSGVFVQLDDTGAGALANLGASGIQTFTTQQTGATTFAIQQRNKGGGTEGDGIQFHGLTFHTGMNDLRLFGVGSRGNGQTTFNLPALDANGAVVGIAGQSDFTRNIVYRLDPQTGEAINPTGFPDRADNARVLGAGTQKVELGRFLPTDDAATVTGLAAIGNTMFAVADNGDFFRVFANGEFRFGDVEPLPDPDGEPTKVTEPDGTPVAFTGLTRGPRNLQNGAFANMLFGITGDGTIFAMNTDGELQPVFPGLNYKTGGGFAGINTIEFSPLDVNLWHITNQEPGDPSGHGRVDPFDGSQPPQNSQDVQGGNSLYFGYADPNGAFRQQGNWLNVFDIGARNSYNVPGGARGAMVSNPLDLTGYSADDLPTLYFNYFLQTEGRNVDFNDVQSELFMRDSFRVYAAAEDGQWIILTTNNERGGGSNRTDGVDELDTGVSGNFDAFGNPILSQETFDASEWRQARVSLAAFAGQQNVRLRFEFSTGASFRTGNAQLGGVELVSVAGSQLQDEESFTIAPVGQPAGTVFEFDLGLVLELPSGAGLVDGVSQLKLDSTTVTYSLTDNTGNNIQYELTDSPATIAQKTAVRLGEIITGLAITFNSERPNVLNIGGLPDADYMVPETEANDTLATAQDLDGEAWTVGALARISNSHTRPHLTIAGTGDGTFDYYSFTATGGSVATFDIDSANFDTELFLYDAAGTLLATNDDFTPADLGSRSPLDSFLTHTFAEDGTYFIAVGQFNSVGSPGGVTGAAPANGTRYQLHVSVDNKPTTDATYDVVAMAADTIQGLPGVSPGHVAINVDQSMSFAVVRDTLRASFAAEFNDPDNAATATPQQQLAVWPFHANTIRLYSFEVTDNLTGLGLTQQRNGDFFGPNIANGDERAQDNDFRGIHIDDIIIGFAERGETVLGANINTAQLAFTDNDQDPADLFNLPRITQGRYQLTVRTAADYGTTDNDDLLLTNPFAPARSFDTNDRLAQQVGILVPAVAAGEIVDGTTFTLSDGQRVLTFEYEVTLGGPDLGVAPGNVPVVIRPGATASEIAYAIRDAINSPESRAVLSLTAAVNGEMTSSFGVDAASSRGTVVELHGPAASNLAGTYSFAADSQLVPIGWGTDTVFGEDSGDSERVRAQGQVLLIGNTITNSSQFGIAADAGNRDQSAIGNLVGDRPYPGAPINFPTPNLSRLAPGVVVMNNILANNVSGGVRLRGDAGVDASVQIHRVINNTFFGNGSTSGDTGLLVEAGASPTVLNNIFANLDIGVRVLAPANAVLGANLFQNNGDHTVGTTVGSFPEELTPTEPLFVSTTNRRFYLAPGAKAIDNSLEALQERFALSSVKNPLGLPASPMLAPDLDVTGQRRVDDPSVNTPAGLGGNVFKDRGAVDRSDFIGLTAEILRPQDNDSANGDEDRNVTYISVSDTNGDALIDFFSILMQDFSGSGPDPATVISSAVSLTENGRLLQEGVDYVFGYNANSRTLRLTPSAGIWRNDSVYQITLSNEAGRRLNLVDGSQYSDGQQIEVVSASGSLTFEFDDNMSVASGAIAVPIDANMSAYEMAIRLGYAINSANIGVEARAEGSGSLMITGANMVSTTSPAQVTVVPAIADLAGNPLQANRPNRLTQFTIVMRDAQLDFGDDNGINVPTVIDPVLVTSNGDGARHALLPVDVPQLALGRFADADANGQPSAALDADDNETTVDFSDMTGVTQGTAGPAVLSLPGPAGLHLQSFTVTDTVNRPFAPITFEFRDSGPFDGTVSTIVVDISAAATGDDVATQLAAAVSQAVLTGRLTGLTPIAVSNTVNLGGTTDYLVDLAAAPAVGRLAIGDVDLVIPAAIDQLDGKVLTIHDGEGNSVTFEINPAATSVNVPVLVDTTATGTPEGVAAAIAAAINGQRAVGNLVLGGAMANGTTLTIAGDDEDGVVFHSVLNAGSAPAAFTVTATAAGLLDAWIDWNQDGDFNDLDERIFQYSTPVQAGENHFSVATPSTASIGLITARFRLSTLGDLLVGGVAIGGEVEDYLVEVVAGDAPIAADDTYTIDEDGALAVDSISGVLVNDTDANLPAIEPGINLFVNDENPQTAQVEPLVDVAHGTLVLNLDGSFSYTPSPDFNGTDIFVYRATDGRLVSNEPTTVTIIVNPINDAPVARDDSDVVGEDELYVVPSASLVANDLAHPRQEDTPPITNEQGQVLSFVSARIVSEVTTDFGGVAGSAVTISSQSGQNAYGLRLNLSIADLDAGAAPTVTLVNDSLNVVLNGNATTPSTVAEFIAAIAASPAASSRIAVVLQAGSDGNTVIGTAASIPQVIVPPTGGSVPMVDASGNLIYRAPANYNSQIGGPVLIEITIQDDDTAGANGPLTSTSTLTLTIEAINDSPEFSMPNTVSTGEDAGLVVIDDFLSDMRPGPVLAADEGATEGTAISLENQQVTYRVTALNADPALFAQLPTITPSTDVNPGQLSFRLADDVTAATPFPALLVEVVAIDSGAIGNTHVSVNHFNPAHVFPATPNIYDGVTLTVVDTQGNTVVLELEDATNFAGVGSTDGFEHVAIVYDSTDTPLSLSQKIAAAVSNPPAASINQPAGAGAWSAAAFVDTTTGEIRITGEASVSSAIPAGLRLLDNVFPALNAGESFDGATFMLTDMNGDRVTFEFNDTSSLDTDGVTVGNVPVNYTPATTQSELTAAVIAAINAPPANAVYATWDVVAVQTAGAERVELSGVSDVRLSAATTTTIHPLLADERVPVFSQRASNESAPRTFTIVPEAINEAPEFTITQPVITGVFEDQGETTIAGFITGARPGPATAIDELATQNFTFTVIPNDPAAFVGTPTLTLNPSTNEWDLTFTTAQDVNSQTGHGLTVQVVMQDDGGVRPGSLDVDTTTQEFSLVVDELNDAPTFDVINEVTVNEDQADTIFPAFATFTVGPETARDETTDTFGPPTQLPVFTLVNDNPALFTTSPSIDETGLLSFQTAPNRNGQAIVVVTMQDNGVGPETGNGDENRAVDEFGVVVERTFTITVNPINDAPEFDINPAVPADSQEDAGLVVLRNFLIDLRNGPLDATDETEEFVAETELVNPADAGRFTQLPSISTDGTLTFQTGVDVNGAFEVRVRLVDEGTAEPPPNDNTSEWRTFTISVEAINDRPLFELSSDTVNVVEDQGNVVVSGFAFGIQAGPSTAIDESTQPLQPMFEIISNSTPGLFEIQPAIETATGNLTFTPAANKSGKSVVIVRLRDTGLDAPRPNNNASELATFTIDVEPINDAPLFTIPASQTVAEDAGLISVSNFATNIRRGPVGADDETAQTLRFEVRTEDVNGNLFTVAPFISVDGTLTFQVAPDVNSAAVGDLRVWVRLIDSGADSPPPNSNGSREPERMFLLQVTPVNDPPVPDAFTADGIEDTPLTIQAADVLAGDAKGPTSDEESQNLIMTQVERTSLKGGQIVPVFSSGPGPVSIVSFTYTPPVDLVGEDTFLYVVTDDGVPARSGTGTITITLSGVNDPPQFTKGPNQTVLEDADLVTVPNWATNILAGTPAATDEQQTQTVSFSVSVNQPSLFEVQPAVASDGTLTFKPASDAAGTAVVTVVAVDSFSPAAQSAPELLTITITPINDAPVFTGGGNVAVNEDSPAFSAAWATAIAPAAGLLQTPQTALDEAGQVVDFTVSVDRPELFSIQPSITSLTASATGGTLNFTPSLNAFGSAVVVVTAVDRGPASGANVNSSAPQTFTITINSVNDAPTGVADNYSTDEDSILNVAAAGVLTNDTDVDLPGDSLSVIPASIESAFGASVTLNADGSFSYDATAVESIQRLTGSQSVVDSFTYTVRDQAGSTSSETTVFIAVQGVDDAPVANDDSYSIGVGQSRLLDVLANDTDIDSDIDFGSITITQQPIFGTVRVNATGVVEYVAGNGFRGTDSFAYTVRDVSGTLSNEAVVTVAVNNAPVAVNDSTFTFKNEPIEIDVLANDSDIDGSLDPTSVEIVVSPSPSGTATVLSDGKIRFTPTPGFSGDVRLSYAVSDNLGTPSNVANVAIRVQNSRWQNPRGSLDVNNDGFISPIDILLIVNYLNSDEPEFLPSSGFVPPPFIDPSGDERVSPLDILLVVNYLNDRSSGGGLTGEGEAPVDYAMMVTPVQMIETVGAQVVRDLQDSLSDALLLETDGELSLPIDNLLTAADAACLGVSSHHGHLFGQADQDEDEENLAAGLDEFFGGIGPQLPE